MKQLLTSVINCLSTVEGIAYAAENWGQLELREAPLRYPCALAAIQSADLSPYTKQHNKAVVTLTVRLAMPVRATSASAGTDHLEESLKLFDLIERVRLALTHLEGEQFNRPELKRLFLMPREGGGLSDYQLTFSTLLLVPL